MQGEHSGEAALSREQIAEYLDHLGLGHVDPEAAKIACWGSLQAFVASSVTPRPLTRPTRPTRLKTYGLDQLHPLSLLLRHALY